MEPKDAHMNFRGKQKQQELHAFRYVHGSIEPFVDVRGLGHREWKLELKSQAEVEVNAGHFLGKKLGWPRIWGGE